MRTIDLPAVTAPATITVTIDADGVATARAALPQLVAGPVRFGPVAFAIVRDGAALPVEGRADWGNERLRGELARTLGLRLPFHPGSELDSPSVQVPVTSGGTISVGRYGNKLTAHGIGRGDNTVGRLDEAGRLIPKSGNPALWGLAARMVELGTVEAAS